MSIKEEEDENSDTNDKDDKDKDEKDKKDNEKDEKDNDEDEDEDTEDTEDYDEDISQLTSMYKIDIEKNQITKISVNLPDEYFSNVISVCDMDSFQFNNQLTKVLGIPYYGNNGCYLFDLLTKKVQFIHSCSIVTAAAFSPNRQIVVGNANGSIQVYDADTLEL